jgi:hypothetical protein
MNVIDGLLNDFQKLTKRVDLLEKIGYPKVVGNKIAAASVTMTAGTSASAVGDLQTAFDGAFYTWTEAAATPGQDVTVEFTNVSYFRWVQIIGDYDGGTTHGVAIQLRNWAGGAGSYHTFDAFQSGVHDITTANGNVLNNHTFWVPGTTTYIGTGGDAGKVQVRFYHPMAGNASHHVYLDVVALYQ